MSFVRYEYAEARAVSLELLEAEVNKLAARRANELVREKERHGYAFVPKDRLEYFHPHGPVFMDDGDYVQVMIREFWQ